MKIISFEGIDGSGKNTQANALVNSLRNAGFRVAHQDFPRYNEPIGALIKKAITGEIELDKKSLHGLMELDRHSFVKNIETMKRNKTDYLVLDRWTLSNIVFGKANGVSIEWLAEIQAGLPLPDITFILDIPVKESFDRRPVRRDLFERDKKFLESVREHYKLCVEILQKESVLITVVNADRPKEVISREIIESLFLTSLVPIEMVQFMLKEFNDSVFKD